MLIVKEYLFPQHCCLKNSFKKYFPFSSQFLIAIQNYNYKIPIQKRPRPSKLPQKLKILQTLNGCQYSKYEEINCSCNIVSYNIFWRINRNSYLMSRNRWHTARSSTILSWPWTSRSRWTSRASWTWTSWTRSRTQMRRSRHCSRAYCRSSGGTSRRRR